MTDDEVLVVEVRRVDRMRTWVHRSRSLWPLAGVMIAASCLLGTFYIVRDGNESQDRLGRVEAAQEVSGNVAACRSQVNTDNQEAMRDTILSLAAHDSALVQLVYYLFTQDRVSAQAVVANLPALSEDLRVKSTASLRTAAECVPAN